MTTTLHKIKEGFLYGIGAAAAFGLVALLTALAQTALYVVLKVLQAGAV